LYVNFCFVSRRTEHRNSDRRYAPTPDTDQGRHDNKAPSPGDVANDDTMMTAVRSKLERIQQLRHHYQQTHRERQGRYLHDDQEDRYERQLKQYEQVSLTTHCV